MKIHSEPINETSNIIFSDKYYSVGGRYIDWSKIPGLKHRGIETIAGAIISMRNDNDLVCLPVNKRNTIKELLGMEL